MKKWMIMVSVLLAAGVASSVPIWSEDFTGETKQVDTTNYGVHITATNGNYDTWYMGANGILSNSVAGMTGEFGQVQGIDSSRSRSASIVLDGSGIAAGDYALQWNFNMFGNATHSVQVWDVAANAGSYTVKYADGTPVGGMGTSGDATAGLIGSFSKFHPGGAGALTVTGQTLNFTYDGTGDVGLQFTISSDVTWGWQPLLSVDDISIEAIPEPATLGLVATFGGGILLIRRKFMM